MDHKGDGRANTVFHLCLHAEHLWRGTALGSDKAISRYTVKSKLVTGRNAQSGGKRVTQRRRPALMDIRE